MNDLHPYLREIDHLGDITAYRLDSDEFYGELAPFSDAGIARFKAACLEAQIMYYGRPRESFYWSEAYKLAEQHGYTKVIVEDLS